jgi:hypothetical protein
MYIGTPLFGGILYTHARARTHKCRGHKNSVATAYGQGGWGLTMVFVPVTAMSKPDLWLTQPPVELVLGALSPGIKLQRCEADHLPLTFVKVKNV